MQVDLMSLTPDALTLLLRTKGTRLAHDDDPAYWDEAKRLAHLAYMRDTIKSSWEFVDYTFHIEGVTRAFTHQLVRTRAGAYAQESQRTVDVSANGFLNPFRAPDPLPEDHVYTPTDANRCEAFDEAAEFAFSTYTGLVGDGAAVQDARGILPTNTYTSIIAKFSLRTLHEMAKVRLCVRTQGEYQEVFRAMRNAVLWVHPWAEDFIQVACVADGTCAFPRYGKEECPVYDPRMNLEELKREQKIKFWAAEKHVAVPVARSGKTM